MPTFTAADAQYRRAIEAPGHELAAAFSASKQVETIDLQGNDITKAILLRLKAFYLTQDIIKAELQKVYAAPAADFFVETTLFFLRVVLEKLAPELTVASEKNIVRKRGSMRPDISVWHGDRVVAAIECKTQLGWNRDGWLHDFEGRESRLKAEYPNAKLYLLVMTGSNWPGFGDDTRVGKQLFMLMHDAWPREFDEESQQLIAHRLETLVSELLLHAKIEIISRQTESSPDAHSRKQTYKSV